MPESINETMVKALPFLIVPILVIVASMFLKTYFSREIVISFPFVIMSLLPSLLGIIPIVFFWIMPPIYREVNGFLFGAAVLGLTSPYPDYYNVFQVLKQTPSGCQIQFYKDDTYYIM